MPGQPTSEIPLPSGSPQPVVFGGVQQPASFSELARKGQDVMTSTLQQYGPAMPTLNHHQVMHQQGAIFYPLHQHPVQPVKQAHLAHAQQQAHPQQHAVNNPYYLQPQPQRHHNPPLPQQQAQQWPQYHHQARQEPNNLFRQVATANPIINPIQSPVYHIRTQANPTHATLSRSTSAGPTILQSSANITTYRPTVINPSSQPQTSCPSKSTATSNSVSPPLDSLGQNGPQRNNAALIVPTVVTNANNNTICLPSSSTQSVEVQEDPLPQKKEIMKFVRDNCEKKALNELIQEYSELEKDMLEAQRNRADIEKTINAFVREAHGQNVEHHPKFIRLKEEKFVHDSDCRQFTEALKYVSDKLDKKFNYKIGQSSRVIQPLQGRRPLNKTARMGTTPRPIKQPSHPEKPDRDDKHTLLDIKDSNLWCRDCDIHYSTLKEFCDHLHKREHMARCSKPVQPPWRSNHISQLPRSKSYDSYKSICAKLANYFRREFTVQDLDEVINPSLRGETNKLKQISLKRERGDFALSDPLFSYKGYDMLIPINGYYCKLCDQVLCDFMDAERHFKSIKHNSEHAKSIVLNPSHERMFRQSLEKSYKEQFGCDLKTSSQEHSPKKNKASDRGKTSLLSSVQPIEAAVSSSGVNSSDRNVNDKASTSAGKSSTVPSQWSARLPYKKPTSKIVDEHDVIADKFDKRDGVRSEIAGKELTKSIAGTTPSTRAADATKDTDVREKFRLERRELEIVPLNKNQPSAALKRLRNAGSKKQQQEEVGTENAGIEESHQQQHLHEHADDNILDNANLIVRLESSSEDEESAATRRAKRKARLDAKKGTQKRLIDDDDNGNDDDVQVLRELHLEQGHKDSPFPELELTISGNVHYNALKDPRLAAPLSVKLNKINLDDYKHMLLDEATLWSRVDFMMTKKEPEEYGKELGTATSAAATYFDPNGDKVPIAVDFSSSSSDDEKGPPFEMGMLENFFCDR